MRLFLLSWLPVAVWMGMIFWMSTSRFSFANTARYIEPILRRLFRRLPDPALQQAHARVRAAAHFVEYMILALLVFRAARAGEPPAFRPAWFAIALGITVAYGAVDEWHQGFEPGRSPRVRHFLADVAGAIAGLVATAAWIGWS